MSFAKKALDVTDMVRFELPANPKISPDGLTVVYEVTTGDLAADGYVRHLHAVHVESGEIKQWTHVGTQNSSPVFDPLGKNIAFLSNREGGSQVWLMPRMGGEARRLTRLCRPVSNLLFHPSGKWIYGTVAVPEGKTVEQWEDDWSAADAVKKIEDRDKAWMDGPKRFRRLYYKADGTGLLPDVYRQLVRIHVETGAVEQLTDGPYHVGEPAMSPDGETIYIPSNRRQHAELELWSDLYRLPAAGGELTLVTNEVDVSQVSVSPDGKHVALFGDQKKFGNASHLQLYLYNLESSSLIHVTEHFPDTLGNAGMSDMRTHEHTPGPLWSKDGQSLLVLATREGRTEIIRWQVGTHQPERVAGGDREIYGFDYDGKDTAVYCYTDFGQPGRLAMAVLSQSVEVFPERALKEPMHEHPCPPFPTTERRLDVHNEWLEDHQVANVEPFWYTSIDGWRMQGFVMLPTTQSKLKSGKVPVVLEVHGGPHLGYGYSFFHEFQYIAAQGYAVVFVNPRGSVGYGQEFAHSVCGEYGQKDSLDVLAGLDAALEKYRQLDEQRVAVTGGSYGGFMTNWLVGHTDRFFAAVSQRSISNFVSFYGVSDIGPFFTELEIGGAVPADVEKLWKQSPLAYAEAVRTPLLLLHSEQDYRCPIEQAEQFYSVLKRLSRDVELLRIPNANHDLSRSGKPSLRFARLKALFEFIDARLPD